MYEDIKEQFKKVIQYSQGIKEPKVDKLFDTWYKAKREIINEILGGQLIYQFPTVVEFTLSDEMKRSRAMEFSDFVYDSFENVELSRFLDLNLDSFFDNKVIDSGDTNIPKGMKLIKAFKYFEKNPTKLCVIQNMASNLVQENKIRGYLCLSVHPLDFLSSSENNHQWRSCHSLDGDYRAGNLSYMTDKSTFMAYLKAENGDVILNGFGPEVKWNSKKWRMLLHMSEQNNLIFAGRQYPFSSKVGMDMVLQMIKETETCDWLQWHDWSDDYIKEVKTYQNSSFSLMERYLYLNNGVVPLKQIVKKGKNSLNYNDLLDSSVYRYPYYTIKSFAVPNEVTLGGLVYCLECEKELITMEGTMRCVDCELEFGTEINDEIRLCDCCGSRVLYDDITVVEPYGDYVCPQCYETHCFVCAQCNEVFYKDDEIYSEKLDDWVCRNCFHDMKESEEKGEY